MSHLPDPFKSQYEALSQKKYLKVVFGAAGGITLKKVSRWERLLKSIRQNISTQFSAWKLAWAEFGRTRGAFWMKHGVGIGAFVLLTVLGGSLYGLARWIFPFLPVYGWALMFAATTILAQTFVVHYTSIAHERTKREELEKLEEQIWSLEDQFQPELHIDYRPDEGEPFVHREQGITQYRVSVRSPIAVPDVELVVNHLKVGDSAALFDRHLRPMNDRDTESGTKRIGLKARREKHWDLVCFHEAPRQGRNLVYLTFIPALGGVELPPGEYQFELMATGGDRPDATSIVTITVAEDHTIAALTVSPGRLSPLLH